VSTIPRELTQSLFRTGILSKKTLEPSWFFEDFFTTDVFVIEIASRIAYMYKGFYAHHIVTDPHYEFPDPAGVETRDLTDDEIEADLVRIKEIIQRMSKKCIIVSHIYTRREGKRYELVKLLERLCARHAIPFFDPVEELGPLPGPVYRDEPLLSHYTNYGHSQIAPHYKKFIESL
jgi:hypothetical protein